MTCTPAGAASISGATARITILPSSSVVCTYRDRRVEPPVPPEPPTPPEPPSPPTPPTPPQPPTPPPTTQLRVVKKATRVTRVGRRVFFTLTVTNVGGVTARNVQLADIPPAAVTLTALKANRRATVARGGAVWRIGTLAPGQSRTVRGSVKLKAGSPGLKRNIVLATAVNAKLVSGRADTRVLAARKRAPRFTG